MTRAEDLLKALNGLKKAAGIELSGEAHDEALLYIEELFRLAGFDGEDAGDGGSVSAPAFADAVTEVRAQAEGELSGNAFNLASKMLDDLISLSTHPASPSVEHAPEPLAEPAQAEHAAPVGFAGTASSAPVETEAAPAGATFDELAAAARARVEEAAASLGAEIVHHYAPDLDDRHAAHEQADVLAGMEFEKRSSEPCSMPEIEISSEELAPEEYVARPNAPAAAEAEAAPVAFDELAAAAKARVEAAAASLGVDVGDRFHERHEAHEHDDPFAGEPVTAPAAAPVVEAIEAASAREVAEAAHDFGSPAMQAEPMADYVARHEGYGRQSDAGVQSEPELQASEAAHEAPQEREPAVEVVEAERVFEHPIPGGPQAEAPISAPATPVEAVPAAPEPVVARPAAEAPSRVREVPPVTVIKKVETGPKEVEKHPEKTFFSLWLDMLFGRRK